MRYFKKKMFVLFLINFFTLCDSASAFSEEGKKEEAPRFLVAKQLWEEGKDKEAADIFGRLQGIPLAEPYISDLRTKKLLLPSLSALPKFDLSDNLKEKLPQDLFRESKMMRDANAISGKIHETEKKMLSYAKGTVTYKELDKKSKRLRTQRANSLKKYIEVKKDTIVFPTFSGGLGVLEVLDKTMIDFGIAGVNLRLLENYIRQCPGRVENNKFLDPRGLSTLKTSPLPFVIFGVNLKERFGLLEALMGKKSVGEAFCDIAKFFMLQQAKKELTAVQLKSLDNVIEVFLSTAAYMGSPVAQLEIVRRIEIVLGAHDPEVKKRKKDLLSEKFYWLAHLAQKTAFWTPDSIDFSELSLALEHGHGCKPDLLRAFEYSTRAVEENTKNIAYLFYNHALRLESGSGTKVNVEVAEDYFRKAIHFGIKDARRTSYFAQFLATKREKRAEAKEIYLNLAKQGRTTDIQGAAACGVSSEEIAHLIPICIQNAKTEPEAAALLFALTANVESYYKKYKHEIYNALEALELSKRREHKLTSYIGRALMWIEDGGETFKKGNPVDFCKKAQKLGSKAASFLRARCYEWGRGAPVHLENALQFYEKSIKQGPVSSSMVEPIKEVYEKSCYYAALLLLKQNLAEKDRKALEYLQIAYKSGVELRSGIAFALAEMHRQGRGGASQDPMVVEKYYKDVIEDISAKNDDLRLEAACALAEYKFSSGSYVPDDLVFLLKEGIDRNDPASLFLLGRIYLMDEKLSEAKENRQKGMGYIAQLAEKKHPQAQALCVFLTSNGVKGVVKQDEEKATDMLKRLTPDGKKYYQELLEKYKLVVDETSPDVEERDSGKIEILSDSAKELSSEIKIKKEKEELVKELRKASKHKTIKKRKFLQLVGKAMKFLSKTNTSDSSKFEPGKGSGFKLWMDDAFHLGFHNPHGRNHTEARRGMVKNVFDTIVESLESAVSGIEAKGKGEES